MLSPFYVVMKHKQEQLFIYVNFIFLPTQYGIPHTTVYTPPTEAVTVEADGPAPVSANECSDLTPSDTSCNFNIVEDGVYTVTLNSTNEIGTTSINMAFNCEFLEQDCLYKCACTYMYIIIILLYS